MDSSGDNLPTHVELTETPAAPVAAEELKPVETDASTEATKTTEEEPPATAKEEENKVETEEKPPAEKIEEKTVEPTKTTPTKSPSKTTRKTPEKTKTEVDGDSASDAAAKPAETEKTPAKGRGRGRKPTAEAVNSSPKTPANRAKRAAPAETPEELAIPEVLPSTEGKRQRKQVERFAVATPTAHEKDTQVPEGRGARLSEIPFIEAMLEKHKSDDLKHLHRIIYGRNGTSHEIKKNLRQFRGFEFTKDSADFAKKVKLLENWQKTQLSQVCDVLGLPKSKTKEDLGKEIVEFLVEPKDLGHRVPNKTPKRKRSSTSSGKRKSKATKKKSEDKAIDDDDNNQSSEESANESEAESEASEPPKSKKTKKEEKTPAKPAKTPAKSAVKADKSAKKSASAKFPTDDQLAATIKKLLKGADLEKVTMNVVCTQVYQKFPGFDLTGKKKFIKETVKEIISNSE